MKKLTLIFVLLIGLLLPPLSVKAGSTGADITQMNITMVVDEHGKVSVDQTMTIDFTGYGIHGPVVWLPQNYSTNWTIKDQTYQRNYYFPITNIKVYGDNFFTESGDNENILIYIGDENVTVSGVHTYHFSYDLQMRDLDLNGLQAFYMNIVGNGWSDPIGLVNFSITLPKGWPADEAPVFYVGAYGNDAPTEVNYQIVGNTLTGSYDLGMTTYNAITIYQHLSDTSDYFDFIPPTDYSLAAMLVLILFTVILALVYLRFGKDDKPIITVEFNPIPGLSSSQAGYIYDGTVDTKDVVSLIIEWANKGYLDITEDESKKDNFTLTKLKEMDESEIRAEKTLFRALFNGRDSVTNKQLQNTFYQHIANAKVDIARHFYGNPQRSIFSKKASVFKVLFGILTMIPVGFIGASAVYVGTYRAEIAAVVGVALFGVGTVLVLLWSITAKRWPSLSKANRFLALTGCGLVSGIYAMIFLITLVLNGSGMELMLIMKVVLTFGLSAANITMVAYMDKRTELGVEYLGKILGLKQFIETAEKDRLEMLVLEDPAYFYKILPYAYVFNVTDIWSKKFESIAIQGPSWYHGPANMNTYLFMNRFNHTMTTMNRSMTSVPQQARGKGGFGGGGGGFSGGGFGGGGGGHW